MFLFMGRVSQMPSVVHSDKFVVSFPFLTAPHMLFIVVRSISLAPTGTKCLHIQIVIVYWLNL